MNQKALDAYVKAQKELWAAQAAIEGEIARDDALYSLTGGEDGARRPADPWVSQEANKMLGALTAAGVLMGMLLLSLWMVGAPGSSKGREWAQTMDREHAAEKFDAPRRRR